MLASAYTFIVTFTFGCYGSEPCATNPYLTLLTLGAYLLELRTEWYRDLENYSSESGPAVRPRAQSAAAPESTLIWLGCEVRAA